MKHHAEEPSGAVAVGLVTERPSAEEVPAARRTVPQTPASTDAGQTPNHLDHVYREYCRRRAEGEPLDPDSYCAQFPSMRSSLTRLLNVHLYLEENSSLLAEAPEIRWPEAGETFLDYHLKLELGKGGFARVFLATEPKLGNRLVALKVALYGGGEAEILGRIQHPNIVPIHSVHEDKTTRVTAVCMPYLGGATLCNVLDRAFATGAAAPTHARIILEAASELPFPLDPAQPTAPPSLLQNGTYVDGIRLIGAQLADALAFIHLRGIWHRDLKPSNVLLSPAGMPMLLDFNLCADTEQTLNRLGGTMLYMSPEQLRATDPSRPARDAMLDARSDIFSLGVILYELATGSHPFGPVPLKLSSVELRQLLAERQQRPPIEAKRLNPNVDSAFSRLIQRCLSEDPAARPQTAAEIASALRHGFTPLQRTKRWIGRHPIKAMAAVLLLAAVSIGSIGFAAFRAPYGERRLDAGQRLYHEGRYDEAVRQFNEAIEADPENHAALFARARAHQQLGDFNLAMQGYQAADKMAPNGRNKAAMAYCLNRLGGLPDQAIWLNENAIKEGFATPEVYNNLGYSQLALNKRKEARKNLDRAIQLDPQMQAAYRNRALVALAETLLKEPRLKPGAQQNPVYYGLKAGIEDSRKAIAIGPGSAELYYYAASLCALAAKVEAHWVADGTRYLEESLNHGARRDVCSENIMQTLRNAPGFQKLLDGSPGRPFPPTTRLVDPVRYLHR